MSMRNIVDEARSEIQRLEKQIQALQERQSRALRLVAAYAEYAGEPVPAEIAPLAADRLTKPAVEPRADSTQGRIKLLVRQILRQSPRKHTRELLPLLKQHGIKISAKDKLTALSTILSKDAAFVSSRTHGWSLAPSETAVQVALDVNNRSTR
jgi:hypothetical protein